MPKKLKDLVYKDLLILDANPDFYDYIHSLRLNFSNNKFNFIDGGGQIINCNLKGIFEIKNNLLVLNYTKSKKLYYREEKELNITIKLRYNIIKERKIHDDGYSKSKSRYTVIFDKSPCIDIDYINDKRKTNLFNIFEDNSYPKIFYVIN